MFTCLAQYQFLLIADLLLLMSISESLMETTTPSLLTISLTKSFIQM